MALLRPWKRGEPHPKKWPLWLCEANIEWCIVHIQDDGKVYWLSGTWDDGEWLGGIWVGGTWNGGVWRYGLWVSGAWNGGTWLGEVWEDHFCGQQGVRAPYGAELSLTQEAILVGSREYTASEALALTRDDYQPPGVPDDQVVLWKATVKAYVETLRARQAGPPPTGPTFWESLGST